MNPRLEEALKYAIDNAHNEAARIRATLPPEDGAPDAPPRRTPDGLWESDAAEWDEDARLITELVREADRA